MSHVNIVETMLPEYTYTAEECMKFYRKWIENQDERYKRKAELIFENTKISNRHSILPIETIFSRRSFGTSNDLYREKSEEFCTKLFLKTVESAGINPDDVDIFITTSCTGYMIPAVNFFVAEKTGMKKDVRHIPITEIGCAAGVAGLLFANDFIKAYPDKIAVVLAHEFPSNTIQLDDFSWENLIGNVIFADGLGCAVVSNKEQGPRIVDTDLYHLTDKTDILGYNIVDSGLKMVLDRSVPKTIEGNFENMIANIFSRNTIIKDDVDHYMFHPGGVKILDKIESIIQSYGKNVEESREVMSTLGNLSSSTIFFIFDKVMKKAKKGDKGLGVSFGPGFSTYQILFEW